MDSVVNSITHLSDMQQHLRTAYKHAVIHGFTDVAEEIQATTRMLEERYWGALRRACASHALHGSHQAGTSGAGPVLPL